MLEHTPPTVTKEQVDVFKSVIKKIKFKYHPSQFDNPVLMTVYTNIEALLFNRTEEIYDSTKSDVDRIDAKLEPFLETIRDLLGEVSLIGTGSQNGPPLDLERNLQII